MTRESQWSEIELPVRAQFLRDLFRRFSQLLETHCTGYVGILSEQVDEVYIEMRGLIEDILHSDGFGSLLNRYPYTDPPTFPTSLHSMSGDADVAWDCGLRENLHKFTGEILAFCLEVRASYGEEQPTIKAILEGYDGFIDSFRKDKEERDEQFLARVRSLPKPVFQLNTRSAPTEAYVDSQRIGELRSVRSQEFDLTKLIQLCEELNRTYGAGCYLATVMLLRAILDHVPPIFDCQSFAQISSNYKGGRSFKEAMASLENSSRRIADGCLHGQIRARETLPNKTQVDFKPGLDLLLAEVVRLLK
jgi:hypothetical protein